MTTLPRAAPLNTESSSGSRLSGATFVALFVAALAIWFVIRVVEVLLLIFIAVLCAVYLSAITDVLERRFRLARSLGLTAAVLATLAAVVGIGALLAAPVIDQTQALISGCPRRSPTSRTRSRAGRGSTPCCEAPSSPIRNPGWWPA